MTAYAPHALAQPTARSATGVGSVRRVRRHARTRSTAVCLGLGVALVVTMAAALTLGDFPLPLDQLVATLVGQGTPASDFIVLGLRLPRVLTGLLVGVAFGLSGAIFQSLARNPLASPDIIGIRSGASAAAVFMIVVVGGSYLQVSVGAFVGALLTALAIYLLAWKRGVSPYRLVLVVDRLWLLVLALGSHGRRRCLAS